MTAGQVALGGALGAVLGWGAKALVIAFAGLGESPLEDLLFFLGVLCALVGAAAVGIVLAGRRSPLGLVLAAVLGILSFLVLNGVVAVAVALVEPDRAGWVWGELNLWLSALVLMVAGLSLRTRSTVRAA